MDPELASQMQCAADRLASDFIGSADDLKLTPALSLAVLDSVVTQVIFDLVEKTPGLGSPEKVLGHFLRTIPLTMAAEKAMKNGKPN